MGMARGEPSGWAAASAVHGIIELDPRGVIVGWNPSARRVLGRGAREAIGKRLADLFPSLAASVKKLLDRPRRGTDIRYAETTVLRADGKRVDVAVTAFVSAVSKDRSLVLVRDISRRKAVEQRLTGTIAALEEAQEVARVASWTWDLAKDELTWSKELYRMLGIDRSVVRASYRSFVARVDPDDREGFIAAIQDTIRYGKAFDCRYRLIGAGGKIVPVRSRGRLIEGRSLRDRRLVGTCQEDIGNEISLRVRGALRSQASFSARGARRLFFLAEAALLLFEDFDYEEALARLCRAVVPRLADRCGIDLLRSNGSVLRLRAGTEDPETSRAHLASLEALAPGPVRRVLTTGEYESYGSERDILPDPEDYGLGRAGSFSSLAVLPILARAGVVGTLTFIQAESARRFQPTDLATFQGLAKLAGMAVENGRLYAGALWREKEAVELNRELETRVEQRTKDLREALRDLDAYASAVAHDLRAPLRALRAFSEALLEECGDALDARGKDYAGRICAACGRLDALVLDLLAYSRASRRDLELGPLDLTEAAEDVVRRMEPELKEAGAEVKIESPLGRVIANRVVLDQVLSNLLSNAVKCVAPGVAPAIRLRGEGREGRVRLWVEDNGLGIAPEDRDKIFLPFVRLHAESAYAGTGLGLAIVKRGVERMGGEVGVESEPGQGSRFWLDLPRG